jgi:anti-anti-sigma factor
MADNCAAARVQLDQHSRRVTLPVVVVDLEQCAYMDTPGLSLMFELKKTLVAEHRQLILQNPSRPVQRILNITGMHRVFTIRNTSADLERIPSARQAASADTQTIIFPTK